MGFRGYKKEVWFFRQEEAKSFLFLAKLGVLTESISHQRLWTVHEYANKSIWIHHRKRENSSAGVWRHQWRHRSCFWANCPEKTLTSLLRLIFFSFFAQWNYVAGAFMVKWIKQPEIRMKFVSLQSKRSRGIMGKALMFQLFKHFPFRWTKLSSQSCAVHTFRT